MSPRLSLEQALETDEQSLALDMLLADRLAAFIPVDERMRWADSALSIGKMLAQEIQMRQNSRNIRELIGCYDINVRVETSSKISPILFVSTYEPQPPTITLYEATLNMLCDMLTSKGLAADFVDLTDIALAHEFFHHLDQKQSSASLAERFRVTTWRFGLWQRQAAVNSAVEIAAHSFAKSLLGLKRFPGILNYVMLRRQ